MVTYTMYSQRYLLGGTTSRPRVVFLITGRDGDLQLPLAFCSAEDTPRHLSVGAGDLSCGLPCKDIKRTKKDMHQMTAESCSYPLCAKVSDVSLYVQFIHKN